MDFDALYQKAITEKTWKSLVPFPRLLLRWQVEHPVDIKRIATISSHQLKHHLFCENKEKCAIVERFIQDNLLGQKSLWNLIEK